MSSAAVSVIIAAMRFWDMVMVSISVMVMGTGRSEVESAAVNSIVCTTT